MIQKTDITYDDVRDTLIRKYTSQRENLNNGNIASYNDYITDEVYGEGAFSNEVDALFHVLAICVALAELKLTDQYFFDEITKIASKYKEGYYDAYFDVGEDKTIIDADIKNVEGFIKNYGRQFQSNI